MMGCRERAADPAAATNRAEPAAEDKANLCEGGHARGAITWFQDDFDTAKGCAQTQGVPLVVDMWAPWCHTCLSMQNTVLVDPALGPYATRFVWVALDTDKARNAEAVEQFAPAAWPTFFVIDPVKSEIEARFVGSASAAQFVAFLREGERAFLARTTLDPNSPVGLLRAGERAATDQQWEAAELAFTQALAAAPADWPRRADAMVSLLSALRKQAKFGPCLAFANRELGNTGGSASAADFIAVARTCVTGMGKRRADAPEIATFRDLAIARLQALVAIPAAQSELTTDDRSDAMVTLRELLDETNRHDQALETAKAQRALLDAAADAATAPIVAMTYNWPRAEVYAYLGTPLALVPALERSIAALPTEYDPPYRLAWIYLQAKDYAKAHEAAMAAYKLGYGVRKARISKLLIDIATAQDDQAALRTARELHLAALTAVPATQQDAAQIAETNRLLSGLPRTGPGMLGVQPVTR